MWHSLWHLWVNSFHFKCWPNPPKERESNAFSTARFYLAMTGSFEEFAMVAGFASLGILRFSMITNLYFLWKMGLNRWSNMPEKKDISMLAISDRFHIDLLAEFSVSTWEDYLHSETHVFFLSRVTHRTLGYWLMEFGWSCIFVIVASVQEAHSSWWSPSLQWFVLPICCLYL